MKVSLSKFYKEVTGKTTVNRGTTTAALTRWGVPFDALDNGARKGDAVDVVHLETAKKVYAAETPRKTPAKKAPRLVDDAALLEMLVRLDDNVAWLVEQAKRKGIGK